MRLSPAEYVIHSLGGVRQTARLLQISPSTVSRWTSRENKFGERGNIPSKWHTTLLKLAKKMKVDLTERDLIKGKNVRRK